MDLLCIQYHNTYIHYNMKTLIIKTVLITTLFANKIMAQTSTNNNSYYAIINEREIKKEYKKAKPMKYCTGIKIEMDAWQFTYGGETSISYKIYSTHVRKKKTYTYTFSETTDNIYNQIQLNKLNIAVDGVDSIFNNKVLIKANLTNCKNAEFTIRASVKSNKSIVAYKHFNLLEYKRIGIDLWMPDEERFIKSSVNPQYKPKDTSDIDIYFKKLSSPLGKPLIYFSCINIVLKDTIRGFMDTTSTIQFHFLSHLYRANVTIDSTINLDKLYFKLIRTEPIYEIENHKYDYHPLNEPIDKNLLMLEKWMKIENENAQYIKDRKNVQTKKLPDNLFKF